MIAEKGWNKLKQTAGSVLRFFAISPKELLFLGIMYLILLGINYWLIALHGFSLSYSKTLPPFSSIEDVKYLILLLFAGYFLFRRSPWYLWGITVIHFLVLFLLLGVYVTTGTFFCESVLYLVYDTNWAETKDFFRAYLNWKNMILLLIVPVSFFLVLHFLMKLCSGMKKYCKGDLFCILFIGFLTLPLFITGPAQIIRNHPFYRIGELIRRFHDNAGAFTREMRHRKIPDFVMLKESLKTDPPVGVLVVGESAIRDHHGIYGYQRDTTPNLLKHKENIILFDDMISVLPMTITALKYWLTDMTLQKRHLEWTIFDALKKSGYRIDIITNQNKSGWADSPLQMIFSCADSIEYMHDENYSDLAEDSGAEIYDSNLLPHFERWLKDKKHSTPHRPRLLVIHLFGSHDPFHARYPGDFSREFLNDTSQPEIVNQYDTSILYTDMILGKILDQLSKVKSPGYMIYFSDHGSVCTPTSLRTPNSVENSAYEIPFFIWKNQEYQKKLPETVKRMKRAVHLPLQADQAHYGLLEMMGLSFTENVESRNFLSEKFVNPERTVLEGKAKYRKKD